MNTFTRTALGLTLASALAGSLAAQAAPTGVRGDMLEQFNEAVDKIVQLAQAIPQEKYTWRPAAGVRSTAEVLMHVTGSNYFILSFAGIKNPTGMTETPDSTTDKAKVISALQASIAFVRQQLAAFKDADLDKPATMFGQATNNRNVWMTQVSHVHEHLGQLIAYARMNGVTPPWSVASR